MKETKKILFISILMLVSFCSFSQTEYKVRNIKIKGNKNITKELLIRQINTKTKKRAEKVLVWKKHPEFTLFVLNNDINRIKSYYNRNGFLNPEISFKLDTLKFRKHINVLIKINEGEFVKINEVKINLINDTINQVIINKIKPKIPLKQNERFVDENVFKTQTMLLQTFSNSGFPYTDVNYNLNVFQDKLSTDINFNVTPSDKCFLGDVSIYGDSIIPESFINKYITFSKGDLYNQRAIEKVQQKLFETELYQYVVIRALKDSIKNSLIPVEIHVKELPRWSIETGLGYGIEDHFRVSATVTRLNFLGGTRRLIFRAKTSYFVPYSFEFKFIQPELFSQHVDLIFNPFFTREREQSYEIDRLGGSLTFQYNISKKFKTNLTYTLENDNLIELNSLQLQEDELIHNKSTINIGTQYYSTNNLINPLKGFKINTNVSYSGLGFNKESHFYKIDIQGRKYIPLSDEILFASKLKLGVMQTLQSGSSTLIEDRYYMGGASSLRGWGRHNISPLDINGNAVGGNSMLEGSVEFRFPIYDILNGVAFFDMGNVWYDSYQYNLKLLHYNTGVGLRVKTPIGPIRFDIATPIINDGFDIQFFLAIGHAF
jgi:outer membrane protein assembly complex protein YaeT